jgi:hypothetical protein
MTIVRDLDETTRDDLAEALTNLATHAKRQQYVIEKFTEDQPTPWTVAHQRINAVLDEWLAAGPNCRTCGRTKASCDAEPRACCEVCLSNGHDD